MTAPGVQSPGTAVTRRERYGVRGSRRLEQVREIVRRGNVRRIVIGNEDGHTIEVEKEREEGLAE